MPSELEAASREIEAALPLVEQLAHEMQRRIVGQPVLIERLLIGLVTGGHMLLEGVPGLAKTLAARTLAEAVGVGFGRVQFTPDLLPADLVGTLVYDRRTGQFVPHYGPVFTNILLADEINRAPAKVQSALLEAMQERRVTIGDTTYRLPEPFLVLATQNPIEHEGTYALPEAQIDRFMLKVHVTYPDRASEREMLDLLLSVGPDATGDAGNVDAIRVEAVLDAAGIALCRRASHAVYADDRIRDYVLRIVESTRPGAASRIESVREHVRFGASPRATLYLTLAAKAHAFLRHRAYVVPEDVKSIAPDVLRHRIVLTYEAEADEISTDDVIRKLLEIIPIP